MTTCTCPSGDGSLRWPCPQHPPEPQVDHDLLALPWRAELRLAGYAPNGYDIINSRGTLIAVTCCIDEAEDEAVATFIAAMSRGTQ